MSIFIEKKLEMPFKSVKKILFMSLHSKIEKYHSINKKKLKCTITLQLFKMI